MEDRFKAEIMAERWGIFQTEVRPVDQRKAFFRKPDEVKGVDCARFFENDTSYENADAKMRIIYKDAESLSTDCKEIRKRNYFPEDPLSTAEADFPIAFARIVYTDYLFLEMELAATYAPQNTYCYAIDAKSDETFHRRIHMLARCFPNVIYTKTEFNVSGEGENMGFAHHECLKELVKFDWKYVVLLQNHDFAIKTNAEMVQIFTWMNGTNDVEVNLPLWERIDRNQSWNFKDLNLFQKKKRNLVGFNGKEPKLDFSKGYVECSLSRAMVEFMIFELNLTTVLTLINKRGFGVDEILIPTLMATDALNAPGGFTHYCIDKRIKVPQLTRLSIWSKKINCHSHVMRHAICVFGVADLKHLRNYPHLFGNKLMPEVDFAASVCWREFLFNKTYINLVLDPGNELNQSIYINSALVRFKAMVVREIDITGSNATEEFSPNLSSEEIDRELLQESHNPTPDDGSLLADEKEKLDSSHSYFKKVLGKGFSKYNNKEICHRIIKNFELRPLHQVYVLNTGNETSEHPYIALQNNGIKISLAAFHNHPMIEEVAHLGNIATKFYVVIFKNSQEIKKLSLKNN